MIASIESQCEVFKVSHEQFYKGLFRDNVKANMEAREMMKKTYTLSNLNESYKWILKTVKILKPELNTEFLNVYYWDLKTEFGL